MSKMLLSQSHFDRFFISIFFIVIICISGLTARQAPKFQRISIDEGLSHSVIHAVLQDRFGFMWFATGHGVNRYDGYEFTVFQHAPTDTTTLSHNTVRAIWQDHNGNLWFGSANGLNRLVSWQSEDHDFGYEYFERYYFNEIGSDNRRNNDIWEIYEDRQQRLWIGNAAGMLQCVPTNDDEQSYQLIPAALNNGQKIRFKRGAVTGIIDDPEGNLWVASLRSGLYKIHFAADTVRQFIHNKSGASPIGSNFLTEIFDGPNDEIWLGSYQGGTYSLRPRH